MSSAGGTPPVLPPGVTGNPYIYGQWKQIEGCYYGWYTPINMFNMLQFCKEKEMLIDAVRYKSDTADIEWAGEVAHHFCTNADSLFALIHGGILRGKVRKQFRATSVYSRLEKLDSAIIKKASSEGRMREAIDAYPETSRQWVYDVDCSTEGKALDWRIARAWNDASQLIDRYQAEGMELQAVFSGSKGFHVELEEWGKPDEVRKENKAEALELKERMPFLDTTIYGRRRAWRVPYSIHGKTGLVCWPLSEEYVGMLNDGRVSEFLEMMRPERLIHCETLKNRGKVLL